MNKFLQIFFLFILSFTFAYSQTNIQIDSLENILKNTKNDTLKIKTSYKLGEYYKKHEPTKAFKYFRQGLDLSRRNNLNKYKAIGLSNLASVYHVSEKYTQALSLYNRAFKIFNTIKDTSNLGKIHLKIANIFLNQNIYDSALIHTLNAENYFKTINDTSGIKDAYFLVGEISFEYKNYKQALEYYNDALKHSLKNKEPKKICNIYLKISKIYCTKKNFKNSYENLQKALKIALNNNIKTILPQIYLNFGNTFYCDGQYNKAIVNYYKAKEKSEDINNLIILVDIYSGLSDAYRKKDFKKTALGFLVVAKNIIEYNNENVSYNSKMRVYKNLSELYHELGNNDIAYKYLEKKEKLHDSLVEYEKLKITYELETKFRLHKKESEIQSLQHENISKQKKIEESNAVKKSQRISLILFISLFVIILITSIWIYNNYLKTKKLSNQLEAKNKKILQAQEKVERIVNFLPEIFFETDIKGKIIYTNDNFFDVTGYTNKDIEKGMTYFRFADKNDQKKIKRIIKNQFSNKGTNTTEFDFIRKDGSKFPAILSINIKKVNNSYEFFGVIMDITEKKKTEQDLLLLKTSVEQSDVGVMITENNGKIVYVNPTLEKNSGYKANELINNKPDILKSGETNKERYQEFWNTIKNGYVWRGKFKNKRKNGKFYWEQNIVTPLKDKNGKITHFVANKEDITNEVKQNEKILKLFTATENSPNSVIMMDKQAKITYVNPAFEKITGYKENEVIGKNLNFFNSNKHSANFYENMWNCIKKGKLWQGTIINKKKNGDLFYDSSTIIPLRNENNKLIGYVCNGIDITSQIKTQKKLRSTLNQLNEKNEENFSSIKYAQRIQNALIPDEIDIKNLFKKSFVLFLPRNIVSGDFYWIFKKDSKKYLAVVDCTGHGVPGAFLSIIGYNFLEAAVKEEKITVPSKILDFVGEMLKILFSKTQRKHNIQDDMEISISMIDAKKKKINFASSRNRLYLVRDIDVMADNKDFFKLITVSSKQKMFKISGDRQYLGKKRDDFNYTNFIFSYNSNDVIYMTTDGYYDQFGHKDQGKFKRKNFERLILDISNKPMIEQKEILLFRILKWKGETVQTDDITVVGIKLDSV